MSTRPRDARGRFITTKAASRPAKRAGSAVDFERSVGAYTAVGYQSARTAVREGRSPATGSGDRHIETDRPGLVAQSRAFMRNNSIYRGIMSRAVNYIVGEGFRLQVATDDNDLNQKIEQEWRRFWRRPEVRGMHTGDRLEKLVCREVLVAGESAIIKLSEGLLQIIEAEQIAGPSRRDNGIKTTAVGRPTSFNICPYGKSGLSFSKGHGYSADDVLFVAALDRPSDTRGVPPMQSAFPMLHRINDVCDSEAIAWQILARFAVAVTREQGADLAFTESKDDDALGTSTDGYSATRVTELEYALIMHGQPGEKIEGIARTIPGRNFPQSISTFLRLLGLPLGMPLELVLLDWTKSNYSQSRAVLEQAYQTFKEWQGLLQGYFIDPVFEWKLRQWVALGRLPEAALVVVDSENGHSWIRPTFPWIDQLKEVQANGEKVERGFATHGQVCKSLGVERDDIIASRSREVTEAIKQAQVITKATGVDVPWQMFAGVSLRATEQTGSARNTNDEEDADAAS